MPLFVLLAVLVLGLVLYYFSVKSRKSYRCPKCGEKIRDVEHMNARRCGMCGSPLEKL